MRRRQGPPGARRDCPDPQPACSGIIQPRSSSTSTGSGRDTPDRPLIHLPLSSDHADRRGLSGPRPAQQCGPGGRAASIAIDLVIYATGNRPELFALWLACRSLGAALHAGGRGHDHHEIAALAHTFGATPCRASRLRQPRPSIGAVAPFVPGLSGSTPRRVNPSPPSVPRALAVLKLTSGSTGLPKATFTTEAQLVADTDHITTAMGIGRTTVQMAAIPLSHAYGIGNLRGAAARAGHRRSCCARDSCRISSPPMRGLRRARVPRRPVHVRPLQGPSRRRAPGRAARAADQRRRAARDRRPLARSTLPSA